MAGLRALTVPAERQKAFDQFSFHVTQSFSWVTKERAPRSGNHYPSGKQHLQPVDSVIFHSQFFIDSVLTFFNQTTLSH